LDITTGPDGLLYFLSGKILRLDMDGVVREHIHVQPSDYATRFIYLPADRCFYVVSVGDRSQGNFDIHRVSENGDIKTVLQLDGNVYWDALYYSNIATAPSGDAFYLYEPSHDAIYSIKYTGAPVQPSPTPKKFLPSPTPTPIPAWFVLDGFGGIHSSNPAVKPSVLPYFAPFDIVRDIEPDPQGRGWYMLDGYGGIHTYPYDLPKPQGLPNFGFDIARNLEVVQTDAGLQFYLLDGYGVIHSTDPNFSRGDLPWFGKDWARDLEPDAKNNSWMVLDIFGYLYSSHKNRFDLPLLAPWYWWPKIQAIVRFPDDTSVLIDANGGRYTNPFYPAKDVMNGLPPDFYFPGFDIIWDAEVVSQ